MTEKFRAVNTHGYRYCGMIMRDRVKERMEAANLSQAELARRVGVAQPTIYKLVHSSKKGSAHLHKIARELGTTPAYLTGEVDDPNLDAPEAPILTAAQVEWLAMFDALSGPDRVALAHVARSMRQVVGQQLEATTAEADNSGHPTQRSPAPAYREFTLPVLFPPEYALTRMFEALLAMVDPAAPTEDQARLLARTLPIGLSQLRDLLPPSTLADRADASPDQPMTFAEPR